MLQQLMEGQQRRQQSRGEQSRAEQNRTEQSRALDTLLSEGWGRAEQGRTDWGGVHQECLW